MCYQNLPGSDAVNARWTRVEDTIAVGKLMGYKKVGIATCMGLLDETNKLSSILKAHGFIPLSVCCKTGRIDKLKLVLTKNKTNKPDSVIFGPVLERKFLFVRRL